MKISKIIHKPFQNHQYEYIFKTFKLESTQDLKITNVQRMQFLIQLVVGHTIYHAQRSTLDHLTFDPFGVTKHDLTYYSFKETFIYLFFTISNQKFHVCFVVDQEMLHL
jgi:hypothetical protein